MVVGDDRFEMLGVHAGARPTAVVNVLTGQEPPDEEFVDLPMDGVIPRSIEPAQPIQQPFSFTR